MLFHRSKLARGVRVISSRITHTMNSLEDCLGGPAVQSPRPCHELPITAKQVNKASGSPHFDLWQLISAKIFPIQNSMLSISCFSRHPSDTSQMADCPQDNEPTGVHSFSVPIVTQSKQNSANLVLKQPCLVREHMRQCASQIWFGFLRQVGHRCAAP
jgi:hypothetical protein